MITNKDILNSLPLLASVLGDQYGVKVVIGGEEARTDGRTIHLPSLPMDCDAELLAMARGFLDHEAGHIRHTDFQAIKQAQMDSVTFNIFNAIEDWRIEKKLGEIYPGCRQNLHWLIKRIFIENHCKNPERAGEKTPALLVLKYVLLTVRLWEVIELSERVEQIKLEMASRFPGLRQDIDRILNKVKQNCTDIQERISTSRIEHVNSHIAGCQRQHGWKAYKIGYLCLLRCGEGP